ncbi:desulfoferrodoxin family protein [Candidatus Omnitrophota bacterium]
MSCGEDILCGVNLPKDAKNLVDLEKKHLPVIDAPAKVKKDEVFEINIKIGGTDGIEHPNEAGHFIEWLELYCGDTFLGRSSYSGGASYGIAKFKIKLSHAHSPLKVRAKCNLHGVWIGTKEIDIQA